MRIKSFKLFENSIPIPVNDDFIKKVDKKKKMQQFKEDIDNLLYPFIDNGYEVSNRLNGGGYLSIYKMDWKSSSKEFKSISDDLFRIFDYLFDNDIKKIGIIIETNKIDLRYVIKPDSGYEKEILLGSDNIPAISGNLRLIKIEI